MTSQPPLPAARHALRADLAERFVAIVGADHALTDEEAIRPYTEEQRGLYHAGAPLVLRPGSTAEVSAICRLASETGTPLIPQGGNTGLTGAQVPLRDGPSGIIVSLSRLDRVLDVDAAGGTMVVEAGVVLKTVQDEAEKVGRLFPLSLGAEGSCQIGGNLSTNAGGTAVLAYGNARQQCLGLEVVLPTGEVWDGLRRLKKDNTGYDLRDLFIGAEGTLGIITTAVLKLHPRPKGHAVMLAGLAGVKDALALFRLAETHCGQALTGFELIPRIGIDFTVRHVDGVSDPMASPHAWYALIDISSADSQEAADGLAETLFTSGHEDGLIEDAILTRSETQARALWHMREALSWAQKAEGGSIKHDVSVPVAAIPDFIEAASAAVARIMPEGRIVAFGHVGDGNIHYNVAQPPGADKQAFLARWNEVAACVHGVVRDFGGSISAEHGIGQMKRDELAATRSPIEIDLMHRIKDAFDPAGIMNPGKVLQRRP